jgi:hypothetical protein
MRRRAVLPLPILRRRPDDNPKSRRAMKPVLEAMEDRTLLSVDTAALSPVPSYYLFTDESLKTEGLVGSYVNHSQFSDLVQDDWRQTQIIAGTRTDPQVSFSQNAWGSRAAVGITGGTDSNWDYFSTQWDGWIVIPQDSTYLYTASDDSSRMWIDLNHDGLFNQSGSEFVNDNWGNLNYSVPIVAGPASAAIPAGTYRIRIQYTEAYGSNEMFLATANRAQVDGYTVVPGSLLSVDAAATQPGLRGSYLDRNLRGYSPQDDWRVTQQPISGIRTDSQIEFHNDGWGSRASLGLTGGTDLNWDNFSVQWDGYVTIPTDGLQLLLRSEDGSRMWIDVNGDGSFASSGPEFINDGWGTGHYPLTSSPSVPLAAGRYKIRIQYEEGNLNNQVYLLMSAPQPTGVTATVSGTQTIPIANPSFE